LQWQIQDFEKAGRNFVRGRICLGGRERGRILRGRILSVAQRLHTAAGRDGAGAGGGRPLPLRASGGVSPGEFFNL